MSDDASFRFFPAPAPLSGFVGFLYCSHVPSEFAARIEAKRLPELEGQLVFAIEDGHAFPGGQLLHNGTRACLFFQPAHLQMIPIAGSIREAVGASLRPAGLRLLMPRGLGNLVTTPLIALEDLWGVAARELFDRLVTAITPERRCKVMHDFLRDRLQALAPPNGTVTRAVELIQAAHGEISTEQLAQSVGCSSRTLRSAAIVETGLLPKQLARVARIRHALSLLTATGVPLSAAAVSAAFSDQAHMSREFRELIGSAPAQLSQRLRSSMPAFSAERNLISTGLLVVPKPAQPSI